MYTLLNIYYNNHRSTITLHNLNIIQNRKRLSTATGTLGITVRSTGTSWAVVRIMLRSLAAKLVRSSASLRKLRIITIWKTSINVGEVVGGSIG